MGDPTTELEPPGLIIEDEGLRPADVLTKAAHDTTVCAIDVTIKSPFTVGPLVDAAEEAKRDKLQKYGPFLHGLEQRGITFIPAPVTALGRRHPDVTRLLAIIAKKVAQRKGEARATEELCRWKRDLGIVIWARAANMINQCASRTAAERIRARQDG